MFTNVDTVAERNKGTEIQKRLRVYWCYRSKRHNQSCVTVISVSVCVIFVDILADGVLPHVDKGKQSAKGATYNFSILVLFLSLFVETLL